LAGLSRTFHPFPAYLSTPLTCYRFPLKIPPFSLFVRSPPNSRGVPCPIFDTFCSKQMGSHSPLPLLMVFSLFCYFCEGFLLLKPVDLVTILRFSTPFLPPLILGRSSISNLVAVLKKSSPDEFHSPPSCFGIAHMRRCK